VRRGLFRSDSQGEFGPKSRCDSLDLNRALLAESAGNVAHGLPLVGRVGATGPTNADK
jgi:hypothetical protein